MFLYAATIFLSAFLLFLVQPIIAKQILPWFGGAASVWATCLVFFQTVLLFGYAYADWTTRSLKPRAQVILHVALLAVSLALLPIIPDVQWKPGVDDKTGPAIAILALLGATIGMQYFLVSTTSPLVQVWFWRRFHHAVPYRLFALSNFASLLALLSYPVLIEPALTLVQQSISWSAAYAAFAVLCAVTSIVTLRHSSAAAAEAPQAQAAPEPEPAIGRRVMWVALSATGSCLLLGVTNHLTQNIASIPFLWVVPLSLYLVTFILCFDHPRWYVRPLFLAGAAVMIPLMAWYSDSLDLWLAAPLYTAGLFVCCMVCHGELYRMRPGPRHLTMFYLMIAVGGALGALLIGIGAPSLLPGYYELGITLIVAALLFAWRTRGAPLWIGAAALVVCATTIAFTVKNVREYRTDTRVMVRNFYGVVRTRDFTHPVPFRAMYHGGINHGGQLLDADWRRYPTTYFSRTSGYGRVFASLPDRPRRVGIIGLGAGALAVYARKGDYFRFYEIDPQVAAVALSEFTFLADAPAQTDVALGDGRLSLEREPPQNYDVLAIDAFSGDSIPMHLITREAMATYAKHVKPDGAIVFQATNRFVDISPVVARLAAELRMTAVLVSDAPEGSYDSKHEYWNSSTDQIIVTKNRALLEAKPIRSAAQPLVPQDGFRVWTDDFYNLFQVLKR
ncbi:MAG TPA: fused MFS/spermidine synthase [Burkholderiales bacterium]|nr:fused MFS/spermidine synthase [Burkholderiales bacterium]